MCKEEVVLFVQSAIAHAVDRQKRNSDKNRGANVLLFTEGNLFLLSTVNLPGQVVTSVSSCKLLPNYIDPFRVLHFSGQCIHDAFASWKASTSYVDVGLIRPYYQYRSSSKNGYNQQD